MNKFLKPNSLLYDSFFIRTKESPGKIALIDYAKGQQLMYRQLKQEVEVVSLRLLEMGIRPGDRIACVCTFSKEYVVLMLASFRLGAIFCPLDSRAHASVLADQLRRIRPAVLIYTPQKGRGTLGEIIYQLSFIRYVVHIAVNDDLSGATSMPFSSVFRASKIGMAYLRQRFQGKLRKIHRELHKWNPALLIFNERDEGVLLSHENLLNQVAFTRETSDFQPENRTLVNLAENDVTAIVHGLLTALLSGGTAVMCTPAQPEQSLHAIAHHFVTHTLMEVEGYERLWKAAEKHPVSFESVRFALFLGKADWAFMMKLKQFAPRGGTGLCMLETTGLCTFIPLQTAIKYPSCLLGNAIAPYGSMSIRHAMDAHSHAGEELPLGFVGEVCLESASIFLGYVDNETATSKVLSKEGLFYTGLKGLFIMKEGQKWLLESETSPARVVSTTH